MKTIAKKTPKSYSIWNHIDHRHDICCLAIHSGSSGKWWRGRQNKLIGPNASAQTYLAFKNAPFQGCARFYLWGYTCGRFAELAEVSGGTPTPLPACFKADLDCSWIQLNKLNQIPVIGTGGESHVSGYRWNTWKILCSIALRQFHQHKDLHSGSFSLSAPSTCPLNLFWEFPQPSGTDLGRCQAMWAEERREVPLQKLNIFVLREHISRIQPKANVGYNKYRYLI